MHFELNALGLMAILPNIHCLALFVYNCESVNVCVCVCRSQIKRIKEQHLI